MHRLICMILAAALLMPAMARAGDSGTQRWVERIDSADAEVLMIGSSMQGEGIDFRSLAEQTGVTVMDIRLGGSLSPWHYCIMNWVLPRLETQPKMVIIETRMNYITSPQKRMTIPGYQRAVENIAGADRELLDLLAFSDEGRPEPWQTDWDHDIPPADSFYWDFSRSIEHSFLPEMVRLSKEHGYQLVILLYKSRKFAEEPGWEEPRHEQYFEEMTAYLHENGVLMLDYTHHPELTADLYDRGDHLSREEGRPIWTRLFAEDLSALLAGDTAPNQRLPGGD